MDERIYEITLRIAVPEDVDPTEWEWEALIESGGGEALEASMDEVPYRGYIGYVDIEPDRQVAVGPFATEQEIEDFFAAYADTWGDEDFVSIISAPLADPARALAIIERAREKDGDVELDAPERDEDFTAVGLPNAGLVASLGFGHGTMPFGPFATRAELNAFVESYYRGAESGFIPAAQLIAPDVLLAARTDDS